jgi:hypothetical protein
MRGFNRFKSKYNAKPTNGFPSKLESALNDLLQLRAQAGEIRNIKRQQSVVLQEGGKDQRIAWKVDFSAEESPLWRVVYFEAKGIETADYRLKLKLWRAKRPAPLEIYKGTHRYLKMVERIE